MELHLALHKHENNYKNNKIFTSCGKKGARREKQTQAQKFTKARDRNINFSFLGNRRKEKPAFLESAAFSDSAFPVSFSAVFDNKEVVSPSLQFVDSFSESNMVIMENFKS